jgi:hydrogenase nickel incorporation protein HypA/HybF
MSTPGESESSMHELSIVEALIAEVEREVGRSGHDGRIRRVDLVIGRLSGVSCDSIRFAFDLLSRGTLLDGAEVHIAQPRAVSRCRDCLASVELDELAVECPTCHSPNITIEGGRDLLLEAVELED